MQNCLFGYDIEFFIMNKKGEIINPDIFLKKWKKDLDGTKRSETSAFSLTTVDGLALEIHTAPRSCREGLAKMIKFTVTEIERKLKSYNMSINWSDTVYISEKQFKKFPKKALELGCSPDINVYTGKENSKNGLENLPIRTAGGHIHMGQALISVSTIIDDEILNTCNAKHTKGEDSQTIPSLKKEHELNRLKIDITKEILNILQNLDMRDYKLYEKMTTLTPKDHFVWNPRTNIYDRQKMPPVRKKLMFAELPSITIKNKYLKKEFIEKLKNGLVVNNSTRMLSTEAWIIIKYHVLLIKLLDIILGITSVLMDNRTNKERRKMYGKAGDYRLKSYGIEYRVLSNHFACNNLEPYIIFGLSRMALVTIYTAHHNREMKKVRDLISQYEEIAQKIINNDDNKLAAMVWQKIMNRKIIQTGEIFFNDNGKYIKSYILKKHAEKSSKSIFKQYNGFDDYTGMTLLKTGNFK